MSDNTKKYVPSITPLMYKSVSQYRRETLGEEVEAGLFKDGSGNLKNKNELTQASYSTIVKNAQLASSSSGTSWQGSGGTVRQTPEVYSPLWLNSNLNLPRDQATINAWCRSFYALNPIVQNAINLHSTYPISKLNIKCPNKKVEDFFNEMIEEIDLMNICVQVAQEYWLLGEAFVYAELDSKSLKWSRLAIQNPDYIVVKKTVIANEPLIMLRPDENLRKIVMSNNPSDIEQRNQLNPAIIERVRRGENIPLDNFYVSHLARKISPYAHRGTGLPVSVFRQLMLFDLLRESKFAQAANMINPLTLVKVGGAGTEYKPTPADLEAWRELIEQAQYDKDFKIITHDQVSIERIGSGQGIYDISGDITQLIKEIYIGLMVPQVVMEGGGDITYANGGISLDVLRQRYMQFRNMMTTWLRRRIFAPISKLNEFYEFKDKKKVLIVPDIDWNHMSLFDAADYINFLIQLTGDPKRVSQQTLYRSLGLEWEEERRKIRKEDIAEAIREKEKESLKQMPLNELRSLTDDADIPEILEPPLPGQSPYEAGPSGGGEPSGIPDTSGIPPDLTPPPSPKAP